MSFEEFLHSRLSLLGARAHACETDEVSEHINDAESLLLEAHQKEVEAARMESQNNGVAWVISQIDRLHIGTEHSDATYSDTTDKLFKALKNIIRDRYKVEVGTDPAPSYPIKAALQSSKVPRKSITINATCGKVTQRTPGELNKGFLVGLENESSKEGGSRK